MALIIAATLAVAGTSAPVAVNADSSALERQVKAAFLYKFASYVEWPAASFPAPDTPVRIGVWGDRALAEELRRLAARRTSGGRPVAVVALQAGEVPADVHIAFHAAAPRATLQGWIRTARGQPVLLVTETPGALRYGSMINFVLRDGRVRFEIGLGTADKAGISVSSRLLSVAHVVEMRSP